MPLWVRTLVATGPPDQVAAALAGHREQLRALRREGRLRVAGEFGNADGWLEVFEARDRLEAESVARASPLVHDGLCSWTLREWAEADLDGERVPDVPPE